MATVESVNAFDKATWDEDERFYFKYVDRMLAEGAEVGIRNGRPWHAVYLIAAFLRRATDTVRLFSGRLSQKTDAGMAIYGDPHVADAACGFLSPKGRKLTIVLEQDIDVEKGQSVEDHPLIQAIRDLSGQGKMAGVLEVRQAADKAVRHLQDHRFCYHMMIMDEKAYRLETDPDRMKAHVNFGDSKTAASLAGMFDAVLYGSGKELVKVGA